MISLVIDTETNGLPPRGARPTDDAVPNLVDLALILAEGAEELAVVNLLVCPDNWTIPDGMVHGISQARAERLGVSLRLAVAAFTNLAGLADEIVAHNLEFDWLIMAAAMHRVGATRSLLAQRVCTADLATPVLNLPPTERMLAAGFDKPKRPSLAELHRYLFNEEIVGAHRALPDARAAHRCLVELRWRGVG